MKKNQEYTFQHNSCVVSYSISFNTQPRNVSCVLALGSGQISRLPQMIASSFKVRAAVIQGLPHWYAKANGSDLERFALEFATRSIDSAKAQSQSKITLIAESQAAPAATRYALDHSDSVEKLVLIQPLGLNTKSFTESNLSTTNEFRNRVRKNTRLQTSALLSDWRILYNHFVLLRVRFGSGLKKAFATHYKIGLRSDAAEDLKQVAKMMPVYIISGSKDQIFRPDEIKDTVNNFGIDLAELEIVKNVPHSPLVSRAGRKLLRRVRAIV